MGNTEEAPIGREGVWRSAGQDYLERYHADDQLSGTLLQLHDQGHQEGLDIHQSDAQRWTRQFGGGKCIWRTGRPGLWRRRIPAWRWRV
eukprot:5870009-Heterocapsa_arctica.AAC.1